LRVNTPSRIHNPTCLAHHNVCVLASSAPEKVCDESMGVTRSELSVDNVHQ
jgi:hypothetical protein